METSARLLGGRYELGSLLASGGMGRVWRARDTVLNRAVAVKILRSEFTDDPGFRTRFRSEAQHAAVMVHPNIASVFDYGEVAAPGTQETVAYLVMELVDGESLAHLLRRERRLGPELTLSIVRQTAAALAAAHAAGIVHRDIKPGNVLVAPDGIVKITDFGVAWSAASVPLTRTGQVIGTAHYLSPEQAQGDKAAPASDVYALGAVAYECLAGRRLFDGESSVQIVLRQIRDEPDPLPGDVPPELRELVMRALAKDPAVRYADGAALKAAADRVDLTAASPTGTAVLDLPLGALPTAPVPAASGMPPLRGPRTAEQTVVAPAPPVEERRRGSRAGLWVLVGALLAVVGVVAGLTLLGDGGDPAPRPSAAPTPTTSASASPTPTASSSAPAPPSTVGVAARDYVGRPVEEARVALTALGLQVAIEPVTTADVPEGTVTAVAPDGEVPLDGTVTLTYAVAPAASPPPADEGDDKPGKGKGKDKKD